MESRLSVAGQAVQPILVMFPLGLFAMALLFDMADLLGGPGILGALAYWNIVAGLVGGALAAMAGAVDVMFSRRSQDRRLGVLRSLINVGVLVIFAVIAMLRVQAGERAIGGGLFAVELLALVLAGFGAWFGGEIANGRTPAFARAATESRNDTGRAVSAGRTYGARAAGTRSYGGRAAAGSRNY